MTHKCTAGRYSVLVGLAALSAFPTLTSAHCDSLEGPVIQDARLALEKGDPAAVLKWVSAEYEGPIREAFRQTMAVRTASSEAKVLADRYFFETLVRIHRAGEGEAFAGLKPATAVDPGIAAADEALESNSAEALARSLSTAISEGIRGRFDVALKRKKHAEESVEAGRAYVEAYVDYIHFVEALNRLVSDGPSHKHLEPVP